jgi:hypothetical protein
MSGASFRRYRPTVVLVLAILHLTGGTLDLIGALCGALGQAMTGAMSGMNPPPGPGGGPDPMALQKAMMDLPGYQAYTYGNLALTLVLGVLLLAAGIGLLGMRPWARALSLVYVPLAILSRVGEFLYTVLVLAPGMDTIMQDFMQKQIGAMAPPGAGAPPIPSQAMGSLMRTTTMIGAVVGLLFIAYPVTVFILLNLSYVKAAFRGEEPAALPPPEDEGWGPIRRPGPSTDVTAEPDPDRDRFGPPT